MAKKQSEQSERSPEQAKRVEGKKGWKEIPIGGMIDEAGSARHYKTGDWKTFKPVVDMSACVHCLTCWINCPDSCIMVEDGKNKGPNLEYCKGCGICAKVCPKKCIKMVKV